MPLRMVVDERGRSCPQVFCDWCGDQIVAAKNGNYEWLVGDDRVPITGELVFTHKNCSYPHRKTKGGIWSWGELRELVLYLPRNLEIHEKDLVKIGKDADSSP